MAAVPHSQQAVAELRDPRKEWSMRSCLYPAILAIASAVATPLVQGDAAGDPRAEVAAALKGMGDAANAHDVERHVGYYAHIPEVTLIFDGQQLVGWETIRDKQREWWNNGKTDVVYQLDGPPQVRVLAPNVVVTTLLMKAHRTLANGEAHDGHFAVSSVWQRRAEGWRVVYSHESTTH
jgi:uncharacterized protein (TIGR02246 family)